MIAQNVCVANVSIFQRAASFYSVHRSTQMKMIFQLWTSLYSVSINTEFVSNMAQVK